MSRRLVPIPERSDVPVHKWPRLYAHKAQHFLGIHRLIAAILKAVCIVCGLLLLTVITVYLRDERAYGDSAEWPQAAPTLVPLASVQLKGTSARELKLSGRIVANAEFEIRSRVSGAIEEVCVEVGEYVGKDDLLLQIDADEESRNYKRAQAALAAARARLEQARENVLIAQKSLEAAKARSDACMKSSAARAQQAQSKAERLKLTVKLNCVSQDQYDAAEADAVERAANVDLCRVQADDLKTQELALKSKRHDVVCAEAQLQIDELNLAAAQQRLQQTRILAPCEGLVVARAAQPGQWLNGSPNAGPALLTLCELSRLFVLTQIEEADLSALSAAQEALLTVDAFPALRLKAQLQRLGGKAVRTAERTCFEALFQVQEPPKQLLRPDMTVRLQLSLPAPPRRR